MFEHHSQPIISHNEWLIRLMKSLRWAVGLLFTSLLTGILGYHFLGNLSWVDSLLEASMILAGMGPVAVMQNDAVKLFASFYALLSGCVFLTSASVMIAPVLHRFLHHFHKDNNHRP